MHTAKHSFTRSHTQEAARGADSILEGLLLFMWLLRRKRSRSRSSDYLNFLTRRPADRLISHRVQAVCLQRAGPSGEGGGEGNTGEHTDKSGSVFVRVDVDGVQV